MPSTRREAQASRGSPARPRARAARASRPSSRAWWLRDRSKSPRAKRAGDGEVERLLRVEACSPRGAPAGPSPRRGRRVGESTVDVPEGVHHRRGTRPRRSPARSPGRCRPGPRPPARPARRRRSRSAVLMRSAPRPGSSTQESRGMPMAAALPVRKSMPSSWKKSVSALGRRPAGVGAEHQDPDDAVGEVVGLGGLRSWSGRSSSAGRPNRAPPSPARRAAAAAATRGGSPGGRCS